MRLLLGSELAAGADVGLRADTGLAAELSGMAFSEETLRLVEDLIAFLRAEKVQVRLFQESTKRRPDPTTLTLLGAGACAIPVVECRTDFSLFCRDLNFRIGTAD